MPPAAPLVEVSLDDLLRFVNLHGAENIAACFVEPIAGWVVNRSGPSAVTVPTPIVGASRSRTLVIICDVSAIGPLRAGSA